MDHPPFVNVHAQPQRGILADGVPETVLGDPEDVRQGHVGESVGGGAGNGSGHVRDAVVNDPVDLEGRGAVGGGTGRLDASTLVDRDIHEDRKSTRLNSSHGYISYAVFCLKKKKIRTTSPARTSSSASASCTCGTPSPWTAPSSIAAKTHDGSPPTRAPLSPT